MASQTTPQASSSTAGAGSSTINPNLNWGKWERSNGSGPMRHYSLDVVQHPVRARMCGFGDKDRRPLAPAAIAKMIVRDEHNNLLAIDEVDIDFFLVTCDLWSHDGMTEVNLVRNPAAASRRRNKDIAASNQYAAEGASEFLAPTRADAAAPTVYYPAGGSSSDTEGQASDAYFSQQSPSQWNTSSSSLGPTLPSISTIVPGAGAPPSWQNAQSGDPSQGAYAPSSYPTGPSSAPASQTTFSGGPPGLAPMGGSGPGTPGYIPSPARPAPPPESRQVHMPGNYTRTLVGPLTANAAKLLDDKRELGIFFTFQDLSVRTEGMFRLRLRLINVGAPPAPNIRAMRVHEHVSPVLAQTFTESFVVYSAKKFPGVPPMTALSLEFGKQGQKLPLRNRPTTRGLPRGEDDEGSGAESEGEE
ncbi:hypothetical protein FRB97_007981 [Tulasnella sp. 331]|nr:hypothetical protein FRB97_007981 [Tulasnella sp. 331]KAG8890488.1 hypothetical protein FRB98_007835 [Tulasnella sp. 332]